MAEIDQQNRVMTIQTTLGENVLAVKRFQGNERLGRLFRYDLELFSHENVDFNKIVGNLVRLELNLPNDKKRYFNGFVSRFTKIPGDQPYAIYHATLRPWTWFLTLTSNCKVFQGPEIEGSPVPKIIERIFDAHQFKDFNLKELKSDYPNRNYCVQYRETDFNFISRLMEEEGICYYFKHEKKKHTMVFADKPKDHTEFPGYESIEYSADAAEHFDRELIFDWNVVKQVIPGQYSMHDYDFANSTGDMKCVYTQKREHEHAEFKMFDYPGDYHEKKVGDRYAEIRLQELQAAHELIQGKSNARGIAVGSTFKLSGFGEGDEEPKYLVTSADYLVELDLPGSSGSGGTPFRCSFSTIPAKAQFRPERTTPVPVVHGLQTARVIGRKPAEQKEGDTEIYTDPDGFACVKVKFHWDRAEDGDNSCWIRVAQPWAGNKWGAIFIPRIGQEVVVSFLEGNIDRPLIIGSVYNNRQLPPYVVPPNKTQSGIKTRSSREGDTPNYNEIQFEDKKGEEKINIHAEKDLSVSVENNKSESVQGNKSISVDGTHTETVKKDTTVNISEGKFTQNVLKSTADFTIFSTIHIISQTQDIWIKAAKPVKVDSNGVSTGTFKEDGNIVISGNTSIRLQSGESFIEIRADGTIKISATKIDIAGGEEAKLGVNSQNVVCDKTKSAISGIAINASAVGMHEITGGVVKIN